MFKLAVAFLLVACASQALAMPAQTESRGLNDIIKCVVAKGEEVKKIADEAEVALNKCIKDAANKIDNTKPEVAALAKKVLAKAEEVNAITLACIKDNPIHPSAAAACIREKGATAQKELVVLVRQLRELGQAQLEEIVADAVKCTKPIVADTHAKVEAVAKEALKCLQ